MKSKGSHPDIPDWKLERYLLGELPPEDMDRIRRVIESSHALRLRIQELHESNKDILERYPSAWMSRRIQQKSEKSAPSNARIKNIILSRFWPMPALPVVAILIVLAILPVLFTPGVDRQGDAGLIHTTRIKGPGAQLLLFRKTDSGSERLDNSVMAREGDLILVKYQPAGKAYGVIISIDGRGTLIRHYPDEGRQAEQLKKDGPVSLDFAYELDDAPNWEKFYFITSDSPFEVDAVIQAARAKITNFTGAVSDSLDLPDPLEQSIFTIRKEAVNE
jgi:hypothetical protein